MMFIIKFYMIKLLSVFDFLLPKWQDYIVFSSFPDFSDNSFALFVYMANKYKYKKYIWLVANKTSKYEKLIDNYVKNDINLQVVKKNSLVGFYYYLISKYVFFTHGLYPGAFLNQKHIVVNLWHGMPLKNIGYLDSKNSKYIPKSIYAIATSNYYKDIIAKSFKMNKNKILLSGQPRNDFLFLDLEKIKSIIEREFNLKSFNKVIAWLPTYRESIIGDIRVDGLHYEFIPLFNSNDILQLDKYLKEKNICLMIKLHPMDSVKRSDFPFMNNIKVVDNNLVESLHISFYSILKYTDALITDYSSVYIDYLLLNRPIGFTISDIKEYNKSRGFVFDDFNEDILPGNIIKNQNEFYIFLDSIFDSKELITDINLKNLYNEVKNHNFSKNIVELMEIR